MANSPLSATVIKVSLSQLSPELLSLVFEQVLHATKRQHSDYTDHFKLRDIDHRSLQKLRQVSKRFNVLATPISYRTLELNEIVVLPGAKQQYPHLFEHIAAYTNHVIIRSDLNLDGIRKVLSGARRLASIQYVLSTNSVAFTYRAGGNMLMVSTQPCHWKSLTGFTHVPTG